MTDLNPLWIDYRQRALLLEQSARRLLNRGREGAETQAEIDLTMHTDGFMLARRALEEAMAAQLAEAHREFILGVDPARSLLNDGEPLGPGFEIT